MPWLDNNCNASNAPSTSAKFLPTVIGYVIASFNFLSGPMMNTDLTVAVSFGVLPSGRYASLGSMSKAFETIRFVSAIIGKSGL